MTLTPFVNVPTYHNMQIVLQNHKEGNGSVHPYLTLLSSREMLLTRWVWVTVFVLSTLPWSVSRVWCRSRIMRSGWRIPCLMAFTCAYTTLLERKKATWEGLLYSSMVADGLWVLQVWCLFNTTSQPYKNNIQKLMYGFNLSPELGSYDCLCRQMAADLDAVVVTVEWVYTLIIHML